MVLPLLVKVAARYFASGLIVKMHNEDSRIKIRAMVLINPAEDLRNPGEGIYGLVTKWYLHGAGANDPVISPITQLDMTIFPPTLIVVCADDELKPHGVDMTKKLKATGVKTTLVEIRMKVTLAVYGPQDTQKCRLLLTRLCNL